MSNYLFRAASLGSKWGFGDGEMLDDFVEERVPGEEGEWSWSSMPLLIAAVRKFLLPALPRTIGLMELPESAHNPIRLADGETLDGIEHIEVEVSEEQLDELFRELQKTGKFGGEKST